MNDSALLRVVIGLVLVLAAILAAAWMARRAGLTQRGGGNLLKQVASSRWARGRASSWSKSKTPGWSWA